MERDRVLSMDSLDVWNRPVNPLTWEQQAEASNQQLAITSNPSYHGEEEKSVEQKEEDILDVAEVGIQDMLHKESSKKMAQRLAMTDEDIHIIMDIWDDDARQQIAKLRAEQERVTGPCYLQ